MQLLLFEFKPLAGPADMATNTPSAHALWRSRNISEWLSQHETPRRSSELAPFATSVLIAASVTMDRMASRLIKIQQNLLSALGQSSSNLSEKASGANLNYGDHSHSVNDAIDRSIAETLGPDHAKQNEDVTSQSSLHILSILRLVSLRAVYAFSGWDANDRQVHEARAYLERWVREDSQSLRKCLWHASLVFQTLRNRKRLSCFHVFYMLIASLILWIYCVLTGVPGTVSKAENGDAIRLDKVEWASLSSWLTGESKRIHLTGLGILEGAQGARRVLEELHKTLLSGTEWASLRRGIAHAVEQVLSGHKATIRGNQNQNATG